MEAASGIVVTIVACGPTSTRTAYDLQSININKFGPGLDFAVDWASFDLYHLQVVPT